MSNTNTARVKVQFVNAAKEGKKKGSIKTEDGRYFDVWSDKLDQFQKGAEYDIEFDTRNYNGKDYFGIQKFSRVGGNGNGASKPNVTNSAHHVDGRSESAASKDAYWTRKEQNDLAKAPRIERQHSQEMALRYFHIRGTIPEDNMTAVRAMIDWFQRDVGHVPASNRVETRPLAEAEFAEGVGGDFEHSL